MELRHSRRARWQRETCYCYSWKRRKRDVAEVAVEEDRARRAWQRMPPQMPMLMTETCRGHRFAWSPGGTCGPQVASRSKWSRIEALLRNRTSVLREHIARCGQEPSQPGLPIRRSLPGVRPNANTNHLAWRATRCVARERIGCSGRYAYAIRKPWRWGRTLPVRWSSTARAASPARRSRRRPPTARRRGLWNVEADDLVQEPVDLEVVSSWSGFIRDLAGTPGK